MSEELADVILACWFLYITVMTVASWFSERVTSFESFAMSIIAWLFLGVIALALRGSD